MGEERSGVVAKRAARWAAVAAICLAPGLAWSDGREDEEEDEHEEHESYARQAVAPAPTNPQYTTECGSCHVAFPPKMLPARSWQALMGGLGDHFGDNAELAPDVQASLSAWLVANAGDHSADPGAQRAAARIPASQTPLRITGLGWFVSEHGEIPASYVTSNKDIRSFANCAACHTNAAKGSFREGEINVPGRGRWED